MKTDTSYWALWASALATCVACTGPNPAFRHELHSDRRRPDAARAPDLAADAQLPPSDPDAAADVPADMASPADAAADQEADLASPGDTLDAADAAADGPSDGPGSDSTLGQGLVAHYPLDLVGSTKVADVTGTRAGTMHGGAGWTHLGFEGAQFANGGALVLDGTSGFVTLPTAGLPTVAGSKSVSLWYWQPAPTFSVRKTLLALSNPAELVGLNVGLQGGVPSVWFWGQLIGTAIVADNETSPGGWTHLVFVQQSTAQRLYVNGDLVNSTAFFLPSGRVTSFMLGAYAASGGEDELWNGRVDDVRVYSRALTAPEVRALAAGAP